MYTRENISASWRTGEIRLYGWMERHGLLLLRLSLAMVFIWFGLLKPLHLSPSEPLITHTLGSVFNSSWFVPLLGYWEIAIGLCLLWHTTLRLALFLLFLHLPGTLLPLLLLPEVCWTHFPYGLTVEGQDIIKNLVLTSAGIVIGGRLRYQQLGCSQFALADLKPLLRYGEWAIASQGTLLTQQDEPVDRLMYLYAGTVAVTRDDEWVVQLGSGHFVGEMSLVTGNMANATTTVMEETCYIYWNKETLRHLSVEHPMLYQSLQSAINQDLVSKLTLMDQQQWSRMHPEVSD